MREKPTNNEREVCSHAGEADGEEGPQVSPTQLVGSGKGRGGKTHSEKGLAISVEIAEDTRTRSRPVVMTLEALEGLTREDQSHTQANPSRLPDKPTASPANSPLSKLNPAHQPKPEASQIHLAVQKR